MMLLRVNMLQNCCNLIDLPIENVQYVNAMIHNVWMMKSLFIIENGSCRSNWISTTMNKPHYPFDIEFGFELDYK